MTARAAILRVVSSSLSPTQRLATLLIGTNLEEWVADRRDPKFKRSWRVIANDLARATNYEIDVSGESLRQWYSHVDDRWTVPEEVA